ncbi:MAG: cytoplasmic protein [Deltaproteobacteria bacterium]|jgi:DNA-directed RNA polymerase subunit RPC12/RpoP|nr:cytoplasmic protein [Deltaproteobacteria bacterium]
MQQNPYAGLKQRQYRSRAPRQQESDFNELEALELYCGECRKAVPVRKRLLLVLPEGDKYEYLCQYCGSKVGDKIDRNRY